MILTQYPGHILAVVSTLAVAAILVWTHLGAEVRKRRLVQIALFGLNLAVAFALLVLIWDPSSMQAQEESVRNEVLVYVDTSQSMSIVDEGSEKNRLDRVAEKLAELFPDDGSVQPTLRLLGFDESPYASPGIDGLTRWGGASNLVAATARIGGEIAIGPANPGSPVATGALVFTDGQADTKTLSNYPGLADTERPVMLVGVGAATVTSDISVTRLDAPLRTTVGRPYTVLVTVDGDMGNSEAPVELVINQNGRPARQLTLKADDIDPGRPISIELLPNSLGTDTLEARLGTLPDEVNTANNHREVTVSVAGEPRLRTLFYTQWLGPDIGRVRSALARIQKVELETRIDARIIDESPYRSPKLAEPERPAFPESAEALRDFDLVVLGPCDPMSLTSAQAEALYTFVAERGGGVLFLPGELGYDLGSAQHEKVRALVPAQVALNPAVGSGAIQPPRMTAIGNRLNVVPADLFRETPAAELIPAYVAMSKPAATTLAAIGEEPALCTQRVGRGFTALLNMRGVFKLYRENENGGSLRVLLSGLITYLGSSPQDESRLELFAERLTDRPSDARFKATVLGEDYSPLEDATVLLTLGDTTIPMNSEGGGAYGAVAPIGGRATILATVEAARDGQYLGDKTVALPLPAARHEMDKTDADHAFLQKLASHLGAEYQTLENVKSDWVEALPATTTVPSTGQPTSIWRNWLLLLLLCGALTFNWFARRMAGLI